ncbi:MAG TPA: hypothetical protein VFW11_00125 [Cyclobacteriaceae bacterium]|nr:hypothetical protein [Cyclobacteriaceae bacterium]
MPVEDAKQNTHRWWGTLKVGKDEKGKKAISITNDGGALEEGDYIFVKTSPESHFITYGTYIGSVTLFKTRNDALKAIYNSLDSPTTIIKNEIKDDLNAKDFLDLEKKGYKIVGIETINYEATSPLTLELNQRTHDVFWNDPWLNAHESRIGKKEHIRLGRKGKP